MLKGLGFSTTPTTTTGHKRCRKAFRTNVEGLFSSSGSLLGNTGKAGFSGILCDNLGQWLSSFSGSCDFATSLNAELHALFHGLSLTWNSGYKSVECDSDSLLALQLVAKGVTTYHPYASIINRICTFKTKQW
ncbi:uncharacterized protein [Glycine max]|uniref:uncharacterized protein n=1 Tax=Glycine max TaxID=3847 RepID=UPI0007192F7D|nr:uncharacterized protein LOC106798245 [Glycine max]|eukprot:XP_014629713.1 uncharacterized protein LOC106798245 [Glycine max]